MLCLGPYFWKLFFRKEASKKLVLPTLPIVRPNTELIMEFYLVPVLILKKLVCGVSRSFFQFHVEHSAFVLSRSYLTNLKILHFFTSTDGFEIQHYQVEIELMTLQETTRLLPEPLLLLFRFSRLLCLLASIFIKQLLFKKKMQQQSLLNQI